MAEYIRAMDTGAGGRAADTRNAGRIIAKTAAYTITGTEEGYTFSNAGATGAVSFVLPAPLMGRRVRFQRAADFPLGVIASGAAQIRGLTIGTTITASTGGQFATIELQGTGANWYLYGPFGTWTIT